MQLKGSLNIVKKEIAERIDPKTTGKFWRKLRNVSGSIAAGLVYAMPYVPSGKLKIAAGLLLGLTTALSIKSHLDKSNKK